MTATPGRRSVLRGGAAATFGIVTTVLPAAAAASSDPTPDGSTGAVTATYVRWVITERRAGAESIQASELVLLDGGVAVSGGGATTVTNPDGDNPAGEGPEQAFDENDATKWLDFAFAADDTASSGRSELRIQFSSSVTFDAYRWETGNDFPDRDPVSWTLEVSDDGSNWTVVDAVASHSTTTDRQAVVGPFDL